MDIGMRQPGAIEELQAYYDDQGKEELGRCRSDKPRQEADRLAPLPRPPPHSKVPANQPEGKVAPMFACVPVKRVALPLGASLVRTRKPTTDGSDTFGELATHRPTNTCQEVLASS